MTMQLRKSTFILFLISTMLVACGGGGGGGGTPTDPGTTDVDTTTPASYTPGVAAPLTTAEESFNGESVAGESIGILLGDGSSVQVPELAEGYEMTLARSSTTTADTAAVQNSLGFVPTGATRELTFYGNGDLSALKPVITIPVADAGAINLETINVLRLGDVWVDDALIQNQITMLPVAVNENGDLSFIDPLLRDGLQQNATTQSASSAPTANQVSALNVKAQATEYEWVGSARYVLMSFQDDLNWEREPKLVRMIPDLGSEGSGFRRPATASELAQLNKQAICNVVLLVHGHNEEEKAGTSETTADAPWLFAYKRRVWDLFYREIMVDEQDVPVYPYQCTAFYEYIFPTYRPIFSPVSGKNGERHETLGEALGRLVKEEFTNNPQLKGMQDNDMQYNVVVVAHSQGGLVARAGFRHLPDNFKSHVSRFISWGSPHHGAALYSLRYALQAGHDMVIDGKRLPLQNIRNSFITGSYLKSELNAKVALDAPGIRDLRWDASKKDLINLRGVFPSITDANEDDINPSLYSDNLATFNDVIQSELAGLSTPYTFFYGSTPKTAELELVDVNGGWWFQYQAQQLYRFANSTSIEQGAALNRLLMASGQQTSDGAVPSYSQQGAGIWGPETDSQSDMDHEEFYGSEPPARNASTIYKGVLTAQRTYDKAELAHESRSCPTLDASIEVATSDVTVTGQVNFPIYKTAKKSLGQSVERIEARQDSQSGSVISALTFSHQSDGSFTGAGQAAQISASKIAVVAIMKDGSEIASLLDYSGPAPYRWKEAIFTDSEKTWTQSVSSDGKVVASTLWNDDQGTSHACELTFDWAMPQAQDTPLALTIRLKETRDGASYQSPYLKINLLSYSGPLHAQSDGSYVARYGNDVDPNSTPTLTNGEYRRELSYLADNITREDFYYNRTPSIYLELGLLCGSSAETWINLNYTTE